MATSTKKPRAIKPLVTPTAELVAILKDEEAVKWAIPESFEAIKDYALKITFSRKGREGEMWEGKLFKAGVHVLDVDDDGSGGPIRFNAPIAMLTKTGISDWRKDEREFVEDCKLAYPSNPYEPFGQAIAFLDVIGNQMAVSS